MSEYKKLQNGSDIRGIAIDGIDGEKPNLTPKEANHIAAGFAKWLREKTGREDVTIAVGRDPRVSGPDLLEGLLQGFCKKASRCLMLVWRLHRPCSWRRFLKM